MKRLVPLLTVVFVFTLDRITKELIKTSMLFGESREVLPFFNLTYLENTGAAFGMGQNRNHVFIGLSSVILVILFVMARRAGSENPLIKTAFALVVGGALGNLYDRITQGSVTDFLDFHWGAHHWPAFNVADSSILVGAVLLALLHWRPHPTLTPLPKGEGVRGESETPPSPSGRASPPKAGG